MQKQVLTIIILCSVSFMLLIGGLVAVMQLRPEILGFPALTVDSAQVTLKSKLDTEILAKREKEKEEFEKQKVEVEKQKKDSLGNLVASLTDSLNRARSEYGAASRQASELSMALTRQQSAVKATQDSAENAEYAQYARMYNAANPKDVAAILNKADKVKAATILKLMKNKVAAKVIESLKPDKAVEIMKLNDPNAKVFEEVVSDSLQKN